MLLNLTHEKFLEEVEKEFEFYNVPYDRDRLHFECDVNYDKDEDYLFLLYKLNDDTYVSSKYYSDKDDNLFYRTEEKFGAYKFVREYDITRLLDEGEDIFSLVLNAEGFYGVKNIEDFLEDNDELQKYRFLAQCLSSAILSAEGYYDVE